MLGLKKDGRVLTNGEGRGEEFWMEETVDKFI